MKPLADLLDRHPIYAGLVGTTGGFLGTILDWLVTHPGDVEQWLKILGALLGVAVGVTTWLIQILKLRDRQRAIRAEEDLAQRHDEADHDDGLEGLPKLPRPHIRVEDNGDGTFTLLDDVRYFDRKTGLEIIAPAGFPTDYASVPAALQSFASKIGRQNRAAIIHDWLYHTRGIPREGAPAIQILPRRQCDRIFRQIMKEDGVRWRMRWRMWLGVRLGGWVPWHFGE